MLTDIETGDLVVLMSAKGDKIGADLKGVGEKYSSAELLRHVLEPSLEGGQILDLALGLLGGLDHRRLVLAVAVHEIGDVVAHHAAEPPDLIALVCDVVADIGGSGHADVEVVGVAAGVGRGLFLLDIKAMEAARQAAAE